MSKACNILFAGFGGQGILFAGKVIAAVLVGLLLLGGQIYVHKMQSDKRRK